MFMHKLKQWLGNNQKYIIEILSMIQVLLICFVLYIIGSLSYDTIRFDFNTFTEWTLKTNIYGIVGFLIPLESVLLALHSVLTILCIRIGIQPHTFIKKLMRFFSLLKNQRRSLEQAQSASTVSKKKSIKEKLLKTYDVWESASEKPIEEPVNSRVRINKYKKELVCILFSIVLFMFCVYILEFITPPYWSYLD